MKVISKVYSNSLLKLNNSSIKFVNGVAEISEEQFQEICDRGLPNIYKEGEEPEYRTKLEDTLRKEVKEGNEEFTQEIKRLKNIIDAQKIEISKKDNEIAAWKKAVEELKNAKNPSEIKTPDSEKIEEEETLRKDLQAMKKEALIDLAKSEDGGGYSEEDLKDKKKDEIIEMILAKV